MNARGGRRAWPFSSPGARLPLLFLALVALLVVGVSTVQAGAEPPGPVTTEPTPDPRPAANPPPPPSPPPVAAPPAPAPAPPPPPPPAPSQKKNKDKKDGDVDPAGPGSSGETPVDPSAPGDGALPEPPADGIANPTGNEPPAVPLLAPPGVLEAILGATEPADAAGQGASSDALPGETSDQPATEIAPAPAAAAAAPAEPTRILVEQPAGPEPPPPQPAGDAVAVGPVTDVADTGTRSLLIGIALAIGVALLVLAAIPRRMVRAPGMRAALVERRPILTVAGAAALLGILMVILLARVSL